VEAPTTSTAAEANDAALAPGPAPGLGYKERKELQSRYRKLERRILLAEQRQTAVAATLSDPAHASDYELLAAASAEAAVLADEIAALYEEWGRLAELPGAVAR